MFFWLQIVHMDKLKKPKPETIPMGIRLTKEQREKLDAMARKVGLDVADLIRIGLDAMIVHYKANGERLLLPLDYSEVFVTRKLSAKDESDKKAA